MDGTKKSGYPKVSVIVPTFNEGERVIPVIESIKKSPYIKEIIVVDDSSERESRSILQSLKGITLISLKENRGKASAIKIGVSQARAAVVMFVDSDLRNLTAKNINHMIEAFFEGGYDMVIGEREKEWNIARFIGMATTLAGERIIKKQILAGHMDIFEAKGYLLESAINRILFRKYKVGRVLLAGVGQWWKGQKTGMSAIFLKDLPWMVRYVRFLGIREFLFQLSYAKRMKFIAR